MAIVKITRDWGDNPSIVRIVTTDSLATVSATGYITSQAANIYAVNAGAFEWRTSDEVLVNAGGTLDNSNNVINGTNAFFQIAQGFASLTPATAPTQTGLTAHAGGAQTGATPLIAGVNTFTTVASAGDSAILPAIVSGQTVTVVNTTGTSMNVFPFGTDTINALSASTALAVAGGATTIFIGASATNWRSK
jgi:hypothetical protein